MMDSSGSWSRTMASRRCPRRNRLPPPKHPQKTKMAIKDPADRTTVPQAKLHRASERVPLCSVLK